MWLQLSPTILPQMAIKPEDLRSLTPEQLLVIDQLISDRSRTVRNHARLATEMRKAATSGDFLAFRAAEQQAREVTDLIRAHTLAIGAALDAFRSLNDRLLPSHRTPRRAILTL